MKLTSIVLYGQMFGMGVLAATCRAGEPESRYADPPMPAYRVEAEDFGASARDITAVCDSAGRELWRFFPGYKIEPFVVTRSQQGPIVLFGRNGRGEMVLKLDTQSTYWSQYSYQFAHEFCHVLCGFDEDYQGNKWFEETLCETASLFAMRAMADAWADDPPCPHWRDYRHALRKYTDDVIAKREKVLDIYKMGLKSFYLEHKTELEENSGLRDLNGAMSIVFLHLFERKPECWEAVRWLNSSPSPDGETFKQYLQTWHDAVPDRHEAFVQTVADLYGVTIEPGEATGIVASGSRDRPEDPKVTGPAGSGDYADPQMPGYRIEANGFNASARDVKAICDSAGRELWRYFPGRKIEPFVVMRGQSGPVVLYQRNGQGEIVVKLDTQSTFWAQYSYQFSYLFANVLCGFDEKSPGNKWFEVTVGEAASLFALRAMSKAWEHDPPYPHWKDYRHALGKYAQNVLDGREKLDEKDLALFYQKHRKELATNSSPRAVTGAMAAVLLRVLEEKPEHWEAVSWLNHSPSPAGEPLERYLRRWHDAVPDRHKAFVREVAGLYGIEITVPGGPTDD